MPYWRAIALGRVTCNLLVTFDTFLILARKKSLSTKFESGGCERDLQGPGLELLESFMMRRHLYFSLFALCLLAPLASAEQFYVRNRPFKLVEKREGGWCCKLSDLATALDLPLTQAQDRWILGPVPEDNLDAGAGCYYHGKRLSSVGADLQITDLQAFISEIGGRYVTNKEMGTVDLYAPTAMLGKAMSCNNVHVLMFHRPQSNGHQVASLSDTLRPVRGLEPVAIDLEDTSHPFWAQWNRYWAPEPTPLVVVVDPSGRILGRWTGQLPPSSEIRRKFDTFVAQRSQTNAQQVAMPAGGSIGGFSGG